MMMHLVICSIFLLCAYPTAVADLAKVASFSTDTRLGRVGKEANSLSSLNLTLLLFLANKMKGLSAEVSGKEVPGVTGSTYFVRRLSSINKI